MKSQLEAKKNKLLSLYLLDFILCHVVIGKSQATYCCQAPGPAPGPGLAPGLAEDLAQDLKKNNAASSTYQAKLLINSTDIGMKNQLLCIGIK